MSDWRDDLVRIRNRFEALLNRYRPSERVSCRLDCRAKRFAGIPDCDRLDGRLVSSFWTKGLGVRRSVYLDTSSPNATIIDDVQALARVAGDTVRPILDELGVSVPDSALSKDWGSVNVAETDLSLSNHENASETIWLLLLFDVLDIKRRMWVGNISLPYDLDGLRAIKGTFQWGAEEGEGDAGSVVSAEGIEHVDVSEDVLDRCERFVDDVLESGKLPMFHQSEIPDVVEASIRAAGILAKPTSYSSTDTDEQPIWKDLSVQQKAMLVLANNPAIKTKAAVAQIVGCNVKQLAPSQAPVFDAIWKQCKRDPSHIAGKVEDGRLEAWERDDDEG